MIWKPTWLLLVFSSFQSSWSTLLALRTRLMNWSYRTSGQGRRVKRRVGERESEREEERESARSANRKCRPRPPASRLMLSLVQKWNPNSVLRIWNDPNQNGMQCCRCYWAYLSLLQPEIMDGRPEEEEALLTTTDGNRHCTDPSNKLIKCRMSRSIQP